MDYKELKERVIKEEQLLRFDHFSNEDALEVGMLLIEEAKRRKAAPAIDIVINGYQVFRYGFEGTNNHNTMWLKRKMNTVQVVHKSSLQVFAILKETGEDLLKDWFLDPMDYAAMGGGFPIYVKGTGIIGCIGVSGLPHLQDHGIIVDVLCKYLDIVLNE